MDPGTVKLAKLAMVVVVFATLGATMASLLQQPTYEASAEIRAAQKQGEQQANLAGSEEFRRREFQALMPTLTHVIDSRAVAEDATKRLSFEMTPEQLLANLTVEHLEGTNRIRLTYEGTNLPENVQIINTVGVVSAERITETSGSNLTASVHEKARVPDYPTPVSPKPLRNVLLTLVVGLALSGALIAGHHVLRR